MAMMAGCLSVLVGAFVGLFVGAFASAAGMALAGGGQSHSDMFTWAGASILSGLLGALTGPALTNRLLSIRERHRVARANMEPASPSSRGFFLYIFGAGLAVFFSWTCFYYSEVIAELSPEQGGPRSDFPGDIRARVALIASIILGAIALFAFIKALRAEPVQVSISVWGTKRRAG
jgi:hypothetical protein